MARSSSSRPKGFARAMCTPVDISRHLNFPRRVERGPFWRSLADCVRDFPTGQQEPWGIPFKMASGRGRGHAIMLRKGDEVSLRLRCRADYVCILHTFRQAPADKAHYLEGDPVGEYELRYRDGTLHTQPVRVRLDVPMPPPMPPYRYPPMLFPTQLSVTFLMPTTADPTGPLTPAPERGTPSARAVPWGGLQRGIHSWGGEPLLYAMENPNPEKVIAEIVIRGLTPSPVIVAGVTAYRGTAHPLRHLMRRMYRVRTPGRKPARVRSVDVDLGGVARVDHTIGPRGKDWLKSPYTGVLAQFGGPDVVEPEKDGEDIYSIHGARDATVSVKLAGRSKPVDFSLGEAYETGSSKRGRIELQRLGGRKQWMQVEIIDGNTGKPTPARLHISGAAGEYIAPYGHHEQVNANWFEDYGADLKIGNRSFAYVPGVFTTDLPAGDLYIELFKGFEYTPARCKVTVRPGQKKLRLRVSRWKDLRSQGWVTADTHVHFLSPRTAWLEAQCEGVNVVNLLASQWGRLFTNVGDISGRVGVVEDDTIVWVGTENRNHMLGHISMLGTKGLPVFPMCCGGVAESWVGDPEFRTLTEWALECKDKDGVVVRPHFPACGFTEDPVLAVMGVLDAVEIRVGPNADFPLQEWYRYLNNGYRVAVAGGTDKMGAYNALGSLRTYAQLDRNRPFTYDNWARAVRAGRTFATTGPLMDFEVEGRRIGESIALPTGGGRLAMRAVAESAWPLGRIEIVYNGNVVASESSRTGAGRLVASAKIPVHRSGWFAARCMGHDASPAGHMAAHTSPVYVTCGRQRPYDGPALQHMLNLTRGGIEYLETLSTRFSERDQERMIRIYRTVERHLQGRLHELEHRAGTAH